MSICRFTYYILNITFFISFISSCTPELEVPKPNTGSANFTKTIAIGGNYMAGYQDGALYEKGQKLSIPALLTEQFKLLDGLHFNQPLMPGNKGLGLSNKTWGNQFVSSGYLGYSTDCKGVTALSPLQDTISINAATPYLSGIAGNSIQNIAVPFATTADYFDPAFGKSFSSGNKNPYYNRLASNPGVSTIFEDAKAQDATFIAAWLGMEDIYNYARSGGTGAVIPSAASFSASLDILFSGLTANGAKGVIANIPDFKNFPFYTLMKWDQLVTSQTKADSLNYYYHNTSGIPQLNFVAGNNGFIINDATAAGGYRQLHYGEYITMGIPMDSIKCLDYGLVPNVINDFYTLDSAEVYELDQAINSYNTVIRLKADQYDLAFVDMHLYFNSVVSGIRWNGTNMNAEFINGGFFSLDGFHPNQKGYALIANEFIKSINLKYNAVVPTVNCAECDGILFP